MSLDSFSEMVRRYWMNVYLNERHDPNPKAKFKTGVCEYDTFLHHLEVEYGIDIEIQGGLTSPSLKAYTITDEQRYTLFLLKI